MKIYELRVTRSELEVLEEALDLYCVSIREDWDGHPPPAAKQACTLAFKIKQDAARELTRALA